MINNNNNSSLTPEEIAELNALANDPNYVSQMPRFGGTEEEQPRRMDLEERDFQRAILGLTGKEEKIEKKKQALQTQVNAMMSLSEKIEKKKKSIEQRLYKNFEEIKKRLSPNDIERLENQIPSLPSVIQENATEMVQLMKQVLNDIRLLSIPDPEKELQEDVQSISQQLNNILYKEEIGEEIYDEDLETEIDRIEFDMSENDGNYLPFFPSTLKRGENQDKKTEKLSPETKPVTLRGQKTDYKEELEDISSILNENKENSYDDSELDFEKNSEKSREREYIEDLDDVKEFIEENEFYNAYDLYDEEDENEKEDKDPYQEKDEYDDKNLDVDDEDDFPYNLDERNYLKVNPDEVEDIDDLPIFYEEYQVKDLDQIEAEEEEAQQRRDSAFEQYDAFHDFYEEEDKGPALEIYGTDLTKLAYEGELEECFGREKELFEMMEILVRRQKNNPVLVGNAGVGKTAIVELFATKIIRNLVPFVLEGRRVISLDLARIVAGSRYRGEFELRFQRILDEVLAEPNIVIFIDEIHNIGGTGSAEGSLDAANILKPVLSRSGFQCIGATTGKEYERIEKDPALNRRFQPIKVEEPTVEQTVGILYGLRPSLESFHNVEIMPGAIRLAVDLSNRYIYERFLPDKAIDLIDRAAAKEVIRMTSVTEGSLINSLVNAALTKVGALRSEAFRRGDIPAEFILQEIENAYRNCILRWVEQPDSIEEEPKAFVSPLSQRLFRQMRDSVLKRVDELLFASPKPREGLRVTRIVDDLSQKKIQEIYKNILNEIEIDPKNFITSLYRVSLFLVFEFAKNQKTKNAFSIDHTIDYYSNFIQSDVNSELYDHVCLVRQELDKDVIIYSSDLDFYEEDVERFEETYELLSQLEEIRIEVFLDFLDELRPIVQSGMVQSLQASSKIKFAENELRLIYSLLGYFSTQSGRMFLSNTDDPEIIQQARQIGNFTGLKKRITQTEIRQLLSSMTGIPIQTLSSSESQKLLLLETELHKRVIGQEDAISAIAKAIRRSRLGIQNPNRPIASFFFCGPTGVGKTEVTKALAATMFNSESDMIRFDMSEFMEKFTISRLIGSPPGYVGYDEGGQLTDAVRAKPYSVVLFDEVEKAHPDVLNILLQILEDGRLTDSQKRLVKFDNTVIIMTSNAAAEEIQQILKTEGDKFDKKTSLKLEDTSNNTRSTTAKTRLYEDPYAGVIEFLESPIQENFLSDIQGQLKIEFEKSFRTLQDVREKQRNKKDSPNKFNVNKEENTPESQLNLNLKNAVFERLSTLFLPEFLNRLDDIIIFKPLKLEELRKICDIMIKEVTIRVEQKNIKLIVDENVRVLLSREGYNPLFGARPLRRLITKNIEDLISEDMLRNPYTLTTSKGNRKSSQQNVRVIRIILNEENKIIIKPDLKTTI